MSKNKKPKGLTKSEMVSKLKNKIEEKYHFIYEEDEIEQMLDEYLNIIIDLHDSDIKYKIPKIGKVTPEGLLYAQEDFWRNILGEKEKRKKQSSTYLPPKNKIETQALNYLRSMPPCIPE